MGNTMVFFKIIYQKFKVLEGFKKQLMLVVNYYNKKGTDKANDKQKHEG